MKRVQAIVSGRKKQCTKLPKPALKEKKSPTTSETSSPGQPRSNSDDVGAKEGDNGAKFAVTSTGSVSSTSSTITAGSSSSVSTANAPTSKGASKIPGTSPKKGSKDGGRSASSSKGQLRKDARAVSKSESFSKKLLKEKQKSDHVSEPSGQAMDSAEKGSKLAQKMTSLEDSDYVKQNRYADENRDMDTNDQGSKDGKPSSPPSTSPLSTAAGTGGSQSKKLEEQSSQGPNLQAATGNGSAQHRDQKAVSPEQTHNQENQRNVQPPQGHQPLHGILKDSGNNGSTHNPSMNHNQNGTGYQYNGANAQSPDYPHVRNSQPPLRTGSVKVNSGTIYQQAYGSLPRNSRSTTPTPENAYSYGSFPRRSNISIPTQQSVPYNGIHDWGPLSRKAESDSSFLLGNMDNDHIGSRSNYAVINYNKSNYRTAGYSNENYGLVNHNYQRAGNVPGFSNDPHGSLYSVARTGTVPAQYYSDTETGRYHRENGGYSRGGRAGSVPLGYESDSGAYAVVGPGQSRFGSVPRSYEAGPEYGSGSSSNLRAHPEDEQYRAVPGRRPIPRRHTVGASTNRIDSKDPETDRKREAFMQLLAQRYPQYADKIQGVGPSSTPQPQQPDKPTRSREGQRRRTALVTYNPNLSGNSLEYDDLGTMNDIEVSSFQRGGFSRTSLPVVRSASTSLERPLGLVFLVYGDQTKKSLLPNEITTLDTVRALFVRAFPDLTLEVLENPRKKIYLLDPATNIYFQLEDLADIKDRSVLKLHDTDNDQPQKVKERQEVRGRTVQMPASRSHSRPVYGEVPLGHKEFIKSQSMPPQAAHGYQELMQDQRNQLELERRSRSRTPEPADRSHRSLSAGSSSRQRFSHSPDRLPTPDRVHLNSIPENRQIPLGYKDQSNYYETVGPGIYRGQYPSGIYDSPVPYQGYPSASPIPSQQAYVACSTRALPSMAYPQRAVAPGFDMNAGFQRSQSYRIPPTERDGKDLSRSHSVTPSDDTARNRIEKMEQQLANLTAWVHYQKDGTRREVIPASRSLVRTASDSSDTLPSSSASSLSDIHDGQRSSGLSSRESTPLSAQAEISAKLAGLRYDLHILRKQQQLNMEAMKDEFAATLSKIKEVLSSMPEAENQANFQKLTKAAITKSSYISDKQHVDRKLGELEVSIEGLRTDVISKQYQVNTADVEGIAQLLNNITKSLADLRAQFTDIHGQMKHVLDEEMKILVSEEKFLKEEPTQIENSLKRCKNISDSLLNLQRLTSGQDQRSSFAPSVEVSSDRKLLPAKTETLVPDQDLRAKEREVGDKSNDKKEQISSRHEAPRLNKRSEMASRNLQPSVTDVSSEKKEVDRRIDIGSRAQPSHEKPVAPAKSVILLNTATTHMSTAATTTRVPSAATVSSVPSLSSASNVASVKPSYSAASTPAKPPEKPTATVSAMTAGVSDTVTTTPTKAAEKESSSPIMKNVFIPLTQTTGRLTSTALAGTDTGNQSPKDGTKSPKKKDTTVYTYQVCGPVNPVFPIPPVFDKPENLDVTSSSKDSPTELKDKSKSESSTRGTNRPPDLSLGKADSVKKGSVSFSDPPVTNIASVDNNSSSKTVNGHSVDKVPLAAQKQTARSAFFSSVNSSSNSPSSPNRNSVSLDPGPVLSPTGVVGKKTEGPTINLVLTGSVSPMSPTNQGSFNVTPPVELNSLRAVENRTSSSTTNFPAHGISNSDVDNNSSYDSQSSTSSDSSSKHKKVPPPPPPRQGSRPQSASILPVNGVPPDLSVQQSREMPRFVGGILGQHRSSGGPLFSTPKPLLQQKSVSRNDQDINSATYININQPDVQSQKNSSQQISDANTQNNANAGDGSAIPSLSSFSAVLNRGKRDSSSESSSSSSGTMGSQQSVVTVVRSSSVTIKDSSKSKPDPPKRHSSLLSKFTGSKESKSKIKNGKAKVNGVDF